jgi:hypothetical protein
MRNVDIFTDDASVEKKNNRSAINKKQTPWPLVRKRTIPTERQPLVVEI